MQWSLLIAVPDYVAFPRREYLRVRQFPQIMSAFPRSLFVQHRKWLIPEAADSQKFGMEVKVFFFSWLYLCCSERWQSVAQGFVFCFHGRSQMCMCACQTKPPSCCNTWRVSPNLNFALSSVTQLSGSVNHGGVSFLKKLTLSVCSCHIPPRIQ